MAGRKLTIQTKVAASTILEVVISMVMIVLVFGIAMMIYTNVLLMSVSIKKVRAQAILAQALTTLEQNTDSPAQSISVDDFRIEQQIAPYQNNTGLKEIHLTAYDSNQVKIAELRKVIINNHE